MPPARMPPRVSEIRIAADKPSLFLEAGREFACIAEVAKSLRGRFTVALCGGATPRGLYSLLASDAGLRKQVPWEETHVFWGDERNVAPDHPESNYGVAQQLLLSRVSVRRSNIHRIRGELLDADQAALQYEKQLRSSLDVALPGSPSFDLVLLGIGTDGHTASLFPGTPALRESERLVVASRVDSLDALRITLTLPVLNRARAVMFLVCGEDKAPVLRRVIADPRESEPLPAALILPANGRLIWLADGPAARQLGLFRSLGQTCGSPLLTTRHQ